MDKLMVKKLEASESWLTKAMSHAYNADPGRANACIDHAHSLAWESGQIISENRVNSIMKIGFSIGIEDRLITASKYAKEGNVKGTEELIKVVSYFEARYFDILKGDVLDEFTRNDYDILEKVGNISNEIVDKTQYLALRKYNIIHRLR